ncbi:MAG: restriction endonuclease subunit S [Bacteroidetes bacterium]|nr:restriction endonuclease subunit S [Bacteroidota bacterium]
MSEYSQIPVPLAPFNEQKRILAKLEQLLTDLDKGIEYLETTKQQLKVYRHAVLKWAFEGNWEIKPLGKVAIVKRGKSKHRPRNAPELFGGKYPFIQTGDVRAANGRVVKEYTETYSEFGLKQSKLWPKGTLCLTIAANIADTAFLGFDACFPDSVVGITSDPNILNLDYINFYIQKIKQEIEGKASATAQKNINVEFLEALEIPVPNPIKQVKIVHDIESRLSVCEKIEETIENSLQQAEALRLSIIKKAFEGKLVPQDPSDESAEKLLERIRAAKGNGKPEKKKKAKAEKKVKTTKKKVLVNG